ncbi:metallophosphoesterase [Gordoniibacillus kamchatkensis]|uniref:Metallophosphoesterase n=1 Tax=Gordoniibacillus kamchatkensis TaxID=1590651 RepID=A0ABR5AM49_9BACL|nr:metallophosphoesterase family protein [Paenibacillus sp. VKM B-2647]KIL42050.1 metallophosphoesterase [Paenibacillus sp. VKM B-2647]
MKRVLAISDIHGYIDPLQRLLEEVKYRFEADQLIFLGDYVDRGPDSKAVIELVRQLVKDGLAIALRGNHDQMFLDFLTNRNNDAMADTLFIRNGGMSTIQSYYGLNWFDENNQRGSIARAREFILSNYKHHVEFLRSLPFYHETERHLFVHAGINTRHEDWRRQPKEDFLWIRGEFINNPHSAGKMVVFGHTPTVNIHDNLAIWFSGDKIGIDGGCAFGYQLNCLEITEDGYKTYSVPQKIMTEEAV